jgi:hypothetical protein
MRGWNRMEEAPRSSSKAPLLAKDARNGHPQLGMMEQLSDMSVRPTRKERTCECY